MDDENLKKLYNDVMDDTDNKRENPSEEGSYIDGEDDPPELLDPDAFYAKDIEEYFEYLCVRFVFHNNIAIHPPRNNITINKIGKTRNFK